MTQVLSPFARVLHVAPLESCLTNQVASTHPTPDQPAQGRRSGTRSRYRLLLYHRSQPVLPGSRSIRHDLAADSAARARQEAPRFVGDFQGAQMFVRIHIVVEGPGTLPPCGTAVNRTPCLQ